MRASGSFATIVNVFAASDPPMRRPATYTATVYVSAIGMLNLTTCFLEAESQEIRTAPPVPDADESSVLANLRLDSSDGRMTTTRSPVRSTSTVLPFESLRVTSTVASAPADTDTPGTVTAVESRSGAPATIVTLNAPFVPTTWNALPSGSVCVTPTVYTPEVTSWYSYVCVPSLAVES